LAKVKAIARSHEQEKLLKYHKQFLTKKKDLEIKNTLALQNRAIRASKDVRLGNIPKS